MLDIQISMVLQIFFSLYFKISSSKVYSLLLRLYCIAVSSLVVYIFILYLDYLSCRDIMAVSVNAIELAEYIAQFLISQVTSQVYLSAYTREVIICDSLMGHTNKVFGLKHLVKFVVICFCLSSISLSSDLFISKFWTDMISWNKYNVLYLLSHQFTKCALDMVCLKVLIVLGLLQNRLMMLRKTLEKNSISGDTSGNYEIRLKLRIVRKCSQSYRSLLEAFESAKGHLQFTVSSTFKIALCTG